MTAPRIAIPMPHSADRDYAERAVPQYEEAVRQAGGEPVRIELDQPPDLAMKLIERCDAVLLPGSRADIDPQKYRAERHPKTADADPRRDAVDELLLQDAYRMRKPILGICYGLQTLNVYRSGTLVQHIESSIQHNAGRAVPNAHSVEVDPKSQLAEIVGGEKTLAVNSSHHQSADAVGNGLRVVARSARRRDRSAGRSRPRTFCAGRAMASGAVGQRRAGGCGVGEENIPRVHRGGAGEA